MSIYQDRIVYSRSFDRPSTPTILSVEFATLCIWALVGLSVSALALTSSFGEQISAMMAAVG